MFDVVKDMTKWSEWDIRTIFEMAFVEDFCKTVYDDKIVYGGWNRIYLYKDGKALYSKKHCSKDFRNTCEIFGMDGV